MLSGRHDTTEKDREIFLFLLDKLEFTAWCEVQRRFGSGQIAIFRQRMIIMLPHEIGLIRVNDGAQINPIQGGGKNAFEHLFR